MRVLHVIHDFLPRHCAGSEIYAFELARAEQRRGLETHVLCAEYDPSRPHGSLDWRWLEELPVTELINNWRFRSFAETYRSPQLGEVLGHVLDAVQPDVLHVHNLLNLSFELPEMALQRGIPSVATLHEYVLLCPSGGQRVHLAEEHVCDEIDAERCARCFRQSPFHSQMAFARLGGGASRMAAAGRAAAVVRRVAPRLFARLGRAAADRAAPAVVDVDAIRARQRGVDEVFRTIRLFVAPSPALGAEFRRFGLPADRLEVSDYGFVPMAPRPRTARDGRLRIGFVGTLVWHKGAHVLLEALRRLPADRFALTVYGSLDTFPDYSARLRELARGMPVRFAGGFDRNRVAEVYADLDVLVICSLWPENSPLVIHEAFMTGVPVVGSRMGGTVDLVVDGVNGLLYDAFSAESLAGCLRRLLDEPGLLERVAASRTPVKTIDDDAAQWEGRYRRVVDGLRAQAGAPASRRQATSHDRA